MEIKLEAIAIVVILILVGTSILGKRLGVAAPLLLVLVGIGVGYLPFMPPVSVQPELVLYGILPPLLYSAAVNTSPSSFRRNFTPIAGLSVALVIISALVIGWLLHLAVPAIPFPLAIALAAVISPTDAVAATSIGKRLGMPERVVSILEGESLLNDASSLVLLKTAIAAVAGSFSLLSSIGNFVYSVIIAIVIGYVIGIITVLIRSHLRNPVYDTVISFTVPFLAFIPAELAGASGVLAVVVTGLYTGHHSAKRFSASARTYERLNWRTMQFVIENGVFLLMGLELHGLVDSLGHHPDVPSGALPLVALALVLSLTILRAIFTSGLVWSMRTRADSLERRAQRLEEVNPSDYPTGYQPSQTQLYRFRERALADAAHERNARLGWREGVAVSWAGMRGVVTLAAAQTIPTSVELRPQLVILAFLVALMSLMLHGFTLPPLIRRLWPEQTTGSNRDDFKSLATDLIEAGNEALDNILANPPANESNYKRPSDEIIEQVRRSARYALTWTEMTFAAQEAQQNLDAETPAQAYLRLSREVLDAQRQALLVERAIGRYRSRVIRAAELAIDSYETKLNPGAQ